MNTKRNTLPDSEWKLMRILWERSPMTGMELTAALRAPGWSRNTVITTPSRLEGGGGNRSVNTPIDISRTLW